MTTPRVSRPAALLLMLGLSACAASALSPPRYAAVLPAFELADPTGALHDRDALLAEGALVVLVTAPTLACGDAQEAWADALAAAAPGAGRWLVLEDLSQSYFPGTARGRMKDAFVPSRLPLLLIDEDGALRTGLGVGEDATVVLVYDARGALIHATAAGASAAGARAAWAAVAPAR